MAIKRHNIDLSKESGHQYAVMLWSEQVDVRKRWPELRLLHHIPNGGSRGKVEAAQMKRIGVKSGVPDLHLPVPRGGYASLYIELKTQTGKTSGNQDEWIDALRGERNCACVCHGWEEAVKCLKDYLSLPRT